MRNLNRHNADTVCVLKKNHLHLPGFQNPVGVDSGKNLSDFEKNLPDFEKSSRFVFKQCCGFFCFLFDRGK